ncbi:hypothetical protein CEP54_008357 [Fusarium duplospermum]|uniref:Uncharacterized protein n=1 Tax=Fusarium duplospermum TaxID=1325734 RepID=A0A428PW91_9HYPO|nr:hypothetical protein CEP54_008357 [Fusarium duplospermum]
MALQRRHSVPVELLVSPEPSQSRSYPSLPQLSPDSAPGPVSKLVKPSNEFMVKAEALASMNFELGLRHAHAHALRLEAQVHRIVAKNADDQDFRREHEARLTMVMREVKAVKLYMARFNDEPVVTQAEVDKLRQEMLKEMQDWRRELNDLRAKLDALKPELGIETRKIEKEPEVNGPPQGDLILSLANPPSVAPIPSLPSFPSPTRSLPAGQSALRMETRAMRREKLVNRQQQFVLSSDHQRRITEAINSTKRWNREHKATQCSDPEFIGNYLMKQGRRDPGLAKVLQQAIQKRGFRAIKLGTGEPWRPHNLTELCHSVSWRDVIDAATEVLVTKRHRTVQVLNQM